jgi:uncharacterized protein YyaL (SSP411 family)
MSAKNSKQHDISERKELIFNWLLRSGILDRRHWALYHSYNTFRRRYGILYTEVTGYGISLFLDYFDWSGDPLYLKYAQKLTRFIHDSKTTLGKDRSCFRFGCNPLTGLWDRRAYSFDTAICISSLVELNKRVSMPRLRRDAIESGHWLVETMQNQDGSFKACIDTISGRSVDIPGWFGDRGCLHAKIAMSLHKLYGHSGNKSFIDGFKLSLKWLQSMQGPSGGILASESESYVFTHSHCYASEALAFAYGKTGEERYLTSFRKSVDWLLKYQNKDGSYYQSYGSPVPILWKRVDATAQACRLFLLMYLIEHDGTYLSAAGKAAKFLLASQSMKSSDISIRGGLYSRTIFSFRWPELNSWTNLFAIHALRLLGRVEEYDFKRAVGELF